jgi:hypothetical protein
MPPSPSTTRAPEPSKEPEQLDAGRRYRQTVYHDPTIRYVTETRRRSDMIRGFELPEGNFGDLVLYPPMDPTASPPHSRSMGALREYHSAPSSTRSPNAADHVTDAKHSTNVRPKAVIIMEKPKSSEENRSGLERSILPSRGTKPPPTPRLTRLPSPELSDLDERPFCECGVNAHVIKTCKTCEKSQDS